MASQDFDQLHSQIDATVHINGPTGKTTAPGLNALLHRFVTDLPAGTSLPADQLAALAAAIHPGADNPYATIADVASLFDGENAVVVEQDLTSHSTTAVPSVAAVRAELTKLVNGAPDALDTLKELADQLASDEQGTAAILATQQQNTQQVGALTAPLALLYSSVAAASGPYPSAAAAMAAAQPGDTLYLRGAQGDVYVPKSLNVIAYGATIASLIVGWHVESPMNVIWRGGTVTARMFCGRSDGTPNSGRFYDLTFGPNAYYQSHTNNTDNPAAADTYYFYRCLLTYVQLNHLYGYNQKRNDYYEDCTFAPTDGGSVFRGQLYAPDQLIVRRGRVVSTAPIFDSPVYSGILAMDAVSTVALADNVVNMLADGVRVVASAGDFTLPAAPESLYPAAGDGGTAAAVEQNLASNSATSVPSVAAVKSAIASGVPTVSTFPPFTATADGAQAVTLPKTGTRPLYLQLLSVQGVVDSVWLPYASISGTTLSLTAAAGIKAGDQITGAYL